MRVDSRTVAMKGRRWPSRSSRASVDASTERHTGSSTAMRAGRCRWTWMASASGSQDGEGSSSA